MKETMIVVIQVQDGLSYWFPLLKMKRQFHVMHWVSNPDALMND